MFATRPEELLNFCRLTRTFRKVRRRKDLSAKASLPLFVDFFTWWWPRPFCWKQFYHKTASLWVDLIRAQSNCRLSIFIFRQGTKSSSTFEDSRIKLGVFWTRRARQSTYQNNRSVFLSRPFQGHSFVCLCQDWFLPRVTLDNFLGSRCGGED